MIPYFAPRPMRILALALAFLLIGSPAGAQEHTAAIGYGAGGASFSAFNAGGGAELALAPGWVATAHVERWRQAGVWGGRVAGGYSRRPLEGAGDDRDIELWFADLSLMARLLPPHARRKLVPFVAAGAGVVNYALGEGIPVLIPDAHARYDGDSEREWAGTVGAGVDLLGLVAWDDVPLGFRLELADRITRRSPFDRLLDSGGGDSYGSVHNVTLTIGVFGTVF